MTLTNISILILLVCLGYVLIYYLKDRKYRLKSKDKYFKEREKERDNWFK